jgi:predicted O-methyltransferase YrrM
MAFEEAGISDRVQVRYGDARQTLPTLSGPFDLVFIDADKRAYPVYYELVLPLVRPGGVILADNVLWSGTIVEPEVRSKEAENLRLFNDRVRQDERVSCVLLPFRDGITFIRKR